MELVKTHYADFGPKLATETLAERHAIHVGRETLRRWMMADGMWLSRKQRKTFISDSRDTGPKTNADSRIQAQRS